MGDPIPEHLKESYYDIALLEIRNYIFNEASTMTIQDIIVTAAQNARDKFEDKNVQLFQCYMKYGEDCFDHKRFDCYLQCKGKCFDRKFFNEYLKAPEQV